MSDSNSKVEEFQFQAEMEPLLHLITHSLYSHREIFLRELISNASDALNKVRFESLTDQSILGDDTDLCVQISLDEEKKTFSISDNGIGMTHDELIANIGTIAKSGTMGFVKNLTGDQKKDSDLIGRFGVGFYSVFMIAEEVTVETKSLKGGQAHRWVSKGTGSYTIEEIERETRGTTISFTFKEEAEEFAQKMRINSIIRKYSDFVSFPISINDEEANKSTAIWARNKSEITEEEYKEFYHYISHKTTDPLSTQHYSVEAPAQFHALVYVPEEADSDMFTAEKVDTRLHLYTRRVFIQDDCKELLPGWLRFVRGVVDTEDLPLNVSREVTQNSPIMEKINKYLVRKLLAEFKSWAENDKEKFGKFWRTFGNVLKEGIHLDFSNREKLIHLFRCSSSKFPNELISLKEYVERMTPDQEEIYYVHGKTKQIIESSPNLEYFKKNDIEVLYLYEEIDDFLMPDIGEYEGKKLVGTDKADLKIEKEDEEDALSDTSKEGIIKYFKDTLGDRVGDVIESKRLIDSACTLVSPKDAMNAHMERMMKSMNQDFVGAKKILEINLSNSLIKNLSKIQETKPEDELLKECVEQIFESASLLDGSLENPSLMVPRTMDIMGKAADLYLKSLD